MSMASARARMRSSTASMGSSHGQSRPRPARAPRVAATATAGATWPWALVVLLLVLPISSTLAFFTNPVDGTQDLVVEPGFTLDGAFHARARPEHLKKPFSRRDYKPVAASSPLLKLIPKLAPPARSIDHRVPSSFLAKILIPRVPGTANNTLVQHAIADVFERELAPKPASPHGPARSGWTLERQTFEANTPEGKRRFTNLIATKEPAAPRKLMLAAHFDSKFFGKGSPNEGFIGATDSAAPCAFLIDTARALDALLDRRTEKRVSEQGSIAAETTLQLVFFDGEEAFHEWTHSDSIYGARALASNWSQLTFPPQVLQQQDKHPGAGHQHARTETVSLEGRRYLPPGSSPIKPVDTIEHMILLDLLGAPDPTIPDYFEHTSWLYSAAVAAERKLREAGVFMWPASSKKTFFASRRAWGGGIEDDHLPFAARGVPILHFIPSPFPHVWHRITDDASALDYPTLHAWAMLMRLLVIEYLDLAPFVEQSVPASAKAGSADAGKGRDPRTSASGKAARAGREVARNGSDL